MKINRLKFDDEELRILQDFERGEFESLRSFRAEKKALEDAARNTLKKDMRVNIRLSSRDLSLLKKRAARDGMPYQTLMASALHKFATGRLRDAEREE